MASAMKLGENWTTRNLGSHEEVRELVRCAVCEAWHLKHAAHNISTKTPKSLLPSIARLMLFDGYTRAATAEQFGMMGDNLLVQLLPYAEYLYVTTNGKYSLGILLECEVAAGFITQDQLAETTSTIMEDASLNSCDRDRSLVWL